MIKSSEAHTAMMAEVQKFFTAIEDTRKVIEDDSIDVDVRRELAKKAAVAASAVHTTMSDLMKKNEARAQERLNWTK